MPLITTTASEIIFSNAAGTATLQAAVTQAQTSGLPLFIAPGTYTQASVTITAPVTIYARKDSVLLRSTTSSAFTISVGSSSASPVIGGVVLRGLNLDGENKTTANGLINVWNGDRVVVEDCFLWRAKNVGVYLYSCEGRVHNSRFANCLVGLHSDLGRGVSIESNYFTDSQNNAIEVFGTWTTQPFWDGTIIARNRIYGVSNASGGSGQWGNAIVCFGVQYLRVNDNFVSNATYSAIRTNYCRDVVISGNHATNIREAAIFNENPADYPGGWSNVVINHNTLNNVGGGIICANTNAGSRRCSVVGNAIYDVRKNTFPEQGTPTGTRTTHGTGIWSASDTVVEGNVIEAAAACGIAAIYAGTWSGGRLDNNTVAGVVSSNILKNCDLGIVYSSPDDSRSFCEIAGNTLVGSVRANIIQGIVTDSGLGYPDIAPGATDMGNVSNAVATRWSFNRNKIVPATAL